MAPEVHWLFPAKALFGDSGKNAQGTTSLRGNFRSTRNSLPFHGRDLLLICWYKGGEERVGRHRRGRESEATEIRSREGNDERIFHECGGVGPFPGERAGFGQAHHIERVVQMGRLFSQARVSMWISGLGKTWGSRGEPTQPNEP